MNIVKQGEDLFQAIKSPIRPDRSPAEASSTNLWGDIYERKQKVCCYSFSCALKKGSHFLQLLRQATAPPGFGLVRVYLK